MSGLNFLDSFGSSSVDYFGSAVGSGDINSDGYADIIIGIPGYDVPDIKKPIQSAGMVTVIGGGAF
jgi:hypothetical protein